MGKCGKPALKTCQIRKVALYRILRIKHPGCTMGTCGKPARRVYHTAGQQTRPARYHPSCGFDNLIPRTSRINLSKAGGSRHADQRDVWE